MRAQTTLSRNHYEILSALGSGAFGVVYLARYHGAEGFTRQVALKVLRQELTMPQELARRMRDEARILGLLHHRAILGADRMVMLAGRAAIVMEYIEGVNLNQLLRAGSVPVSVALEIVAEIAAALRVGYETAGPDGKPLHLLHRDIKLSNALLTRHGEVKVLDFGIARADFVGRESETQSICFGSPSYMPPERLDQEAGPREGPEGDVYSLGVVLWELITRREMGRTSAFPMRHNARLVESLARAREAAPELEGLHALLGAMLDFEPEARPTAREVERVCLQLAERAATEPLRYWAERSVPPLIGRWEQADPSGWVGQELREDTGPPITVGQMIEKEGRAGGSEGGAAWEASAPPKEPWWSGAPWVLLGVLLVAVAVVPSVLLAWGLMRSQDVAAQDPVVPEPPAPVPEPVPEPAPEPTPTPNLPPPSKLTDTTPVVAPEVSPNPTKVSGAATTKKARSKASRSGAKASCPAGQISASFAGPVEQVMLSRSGGGTSLPGCLLEGGVYQVSVVVGGESHSSGTALIRPAPGQDAVRLDCTEKGCKVAALE